jgi:hypothetical protein
MSEHRDGSESAPPPHRTRGPARLLIVAAVAATLVVVGLIDRAGAPAPAAGASVPPVPVAAPALALSSSWFCAGATDLHRSIRSSGGNSGSDRGAAPGSVVIANSGLATATGVVTLVPNQGSPVRVPISVDADSRITVTEDVPQGAPWIGAIVDVNAGAVAVTQQMSGAAGAAATPCATSGSAQWYFPTGVTLVNASETLSLLNPYSSDTVVDLSFTTDQGLGQPQEFQGLVVAPGQLLAVNLGDHLRRRQAIATTVTARSGRLVAWRTEVVTPPTAHEAILGTPAASAPFADPAAPIAGVTVTLGLPAPALTWTWPDGETANGVDERYAIYNPGPGSADLKLSLILDQGVAEPFDLSVGPEQVITVISSQEVRIPPGVGHAAVLESLNNVPVVAERTLAATSPSTWSGLGTLPGARLAASRWLLATSGADRSHDAVVLVYNPGRAAAQAVLEGLSGRAQVPLTAVTVGAGRRVAIHVSHVGAGLNEPLVVSASGPVYVESDFYGQAGTPGISLSFGVPLNP